MKDILLIIFLLFLFTGCNKKSVIYQKKEPIKRDCTFISYNKAKTNNTLFSYNNSLSNRISVVEETQGYLLNEVDVLSHYNTESEHEIMIGLITEMLERLNAKQKESK